MGRIWMALGGVFGAGTVSMAAVAAHALPQRLDVRSLETVQIAIQMQGWHMLALLLTGLWVLRAPPSAARLGNLAGAGFAFGTLLFCGGVYAHFIGGWPTAFAAPLGGVLLILSWLLLAASALAGRGPA